MKLRLLGLGAVLAASLVTTAPARSAPFDPGAECGGAHAIKRVAAVGVPLASPVAVGESCPGVRPGAVLRIPSKSAQCTFNFLFQGSDGYRYAATAGHCIMLGSSKTEDSWGVGHGPAAQDGSGKRIGEFAYGVLKDPKDLALIRLDKDAQASPEMCHFGGPTRINNDRTATAVTLNHFGQGLAVGAAIPGRTEVATDLADPDRVYATGVAISGDSGSPVETADGGAVGVLVATGAAAGVGTSGIPFVANVFVTRLAPQLAGAARLTGVTYTLLTAPLR